MKQETAPTNRAICIVTGIYFALTLGVFIGGFFLPMLFLVAAVLGLLGAYCYYFWTPVAYELNRDGLTVFFRVRQKIFPSVVKCSCVEKGFLSWMGLRLWGDGGVFAGSGVFWNSRLGVFLAYVTRSKPKELVLVETTRWKIIISPANPVEFIQSAPRLV